MAESVLEVVEKLQSRLSPSTEPRKLHKTLKRLSELPITVDILVETGVGKAVNGLRKHEVVGDIAKALVIQWKKLVPQETPRVAEPEEREHRKSNVRKRPRSPSPREDEPEEDYEEDIPLHGSGGERHRALSESHRAYRKEEESWRQYSDREDSDDGRGYSPEPSHSPPRVYMDTFKDRSMHKQSKEQKSSYKEKHRSEANLERKKEKLVPKEEPKVHTSFAGSSRERTSSESKEHTFKKEKSRHSAPGDVSDTKKQKHQEKSKGEKQRVDTQTTDRGKRPAERDSESSSRDKGDKNKAKLKSSDSGTQEKKSIKFSEPPMESDLDEMFEQPTKSFEQCLSYEQPKKKKKKPVVKPSASVSDKSSKKPSESSSKDLSKQKAETTPSKNKSAHKKESTSLLLSKMDQVPSLPDIPLPLIQPNYRPLPSIEPAPLMTPKRKAPMLYAQEEEEGSGFTGRRFNSKMQVYSGSKTSYLPKMMSLYQQCIRVLSNNIDSIYEVGGVPFSVLEPVLEKCTPDQLYRIEECNHVLIEDTDRLWMNHCQRDFKKQEPEELENWRELYLRLHEAREHRLHMLTQNIRSAHANKPQGRQAKMAFVNSAVKPPRDVRRRQEKFGTGAALVSEKSSPCRIKPFMPVSTSSNHHSEEPRSFDEPSTSSTSSTPSSVQAGHDPRKPQIKKVAPMMAKTIKAFKNRFSRR